MNTLTRGERGRLYARLARRAVLFLFCALLTAFVARYFRVCAPLIVVLLTAHLLNPLVSKLHQRLGIPRRLLAFVLVVLVCVALIALTVRFLYAAVGEITSLARNIQPLWDACISIAAFVSDRLKWLLDFLPSDTEAMFANLTTGAALWLQETGKVFLNSVLANAASIPSKVGGGVAGIVIFIIATYVATAEHDATVRLIKRHLGDRLYARVRTLKDIIQTAFGGYFKAQLLLALFAFVVMFPALAIYGQAYAFLIALFLAVIDFLPIVGAIAMLAPWGIAELVGGNVGKGAFLLILGASFFLVRRLVEPKIMGSQTGLHPLAALMSISVGISIAGFGGAILGPVVAMAVIDIVKSGILDGTAKDIRLAAADIAGIWKRGA